jgi:hypothetical protein
MAKAEEQLRQGRARDPRTALPLATSGVSSRFQAQGIAHIFIPILMGPTAKYILHLDLNPLPA